MRAPIALFNICLAVVSLSAVALGGCGGAVDPTPNGTTGHASSPLSDESSQCVPALPSPALAVPAGNRVSFHLDAIGVQIYACSATAAGYGWVFQAPEATLYKHGGHVSGKHYAGPTWEANDGSTVVGAKVAAATPDPTAVPWLLLRAVSHAGDGKMDEVTFVQRLETTGGLAPSGGCDASTVGASARVPYTATYFFYEAGDGEGDHGEASGDHGDCR